MGSRKKTASVRKPVSGTWTMGLLGCLIASVVLSTILLGGRQYILLKYYDQIRTMEREVVTLQMEVEEGREILESLEDDPFWIEKTARERMNYALPGELIFRFEELD